MSSKQQIMINHILKNNQNIPVVIPVDSANVFFNQKVLSAFVPEKDLFSKSFFDSFCFSLTEKTFLIIESMDEIKKEEQMKFLTLFKDCRIGGVKLPLQVQIVIPMHKASNLTDVLAKFCLIYHER